MPTAEQIGKRASIISMAASGSLAVLKISVGLLAGSTSVVADGIESAGDVVASGLILFGLWIAARPPDENHPYGHGRFETITGFLVGLGLVTTGIGIAIGSLTGIGETHAAPARYAIYPLIVSIIVKSALSTYKFRTGKKIGSSALIADAWNDTVDILSGAVALCAVGLTLFDPDRFQAADHYGGFAVGLIVVVLGIQVVRETMYHLMDTMPEDDRLALLRQTALRIPGAQRVEKCYARKTGLRWHVDLHLEVDPNITVKQGHDIAERTRNLLKRDVPWVADVLVHVEPFGTVHSPIPGDLTTSRIIDED
jgi:cation diffusion facilitator family transporter